MPNHSKHRRGSNAQISKTENGKDSDGDEDSEAPSVSKKKCSVPKSNGSNTNSDDVELVSTLELPQQSEDERREIRSTYRDLIQDTTQFTDIHSLSATIQTANNLFSRVTTTREARLDSKLISICANVGHSRVQALHTGLVQFDPLDFVERLGLFLSQSGKQNVKESDENEEDYELPDEVWNEFGERISVLFKRTPSFHFMLGSFEKGPPPVLQPKATRKKKDNDIDVKKAVVPKKITDMGKSDQETTTEEVERVLGVLKGLHSQYEQPICYFEFVTNPDSFSKTIENMFHVSFLIKDNLVSLKLDEDHLPIIEPIRNTSSQNSSENSTDICELITSFSQADWLKVVEVYKIKKPLIPSRTNSNIKTEKSKKKSK